MTEEGYVDFGDVSRQQLDLQCQYGSRYIDGYIDGWPSLSKGLSNIGFDIHGCVNNYHAMKIHRDDVEEFVRRVKKYNESIVGKCHQGSCIGG